MLASGASSKCSGVSCRHGESIEPKQRELHLCSSMEMVSTLAAAAIGASRTGNSEALALLGMKPRDEAKVRSASATQVHALGWLVHL
mgnify:CR=1 FL=1